MNMTKKHAFLLSTILCTVLIAAMALTLMGCNDTRLEDITAAGADITASYDPAAPLHRGSGDTAFDFSVTDGAGTTSYWVIHTDKTTVGEALTELGLLAGDPGDYGLYVKTVCDITADYNKDGAYWAFYEGDKYAARGVDQTEIASGVTYAFKVEKG